MENNKIKDCKMHFTDKNTAPYEFYSCDIAKALKWMADTNAPVLAIETPWCWLSVMDVDVGKSVTSIFK